MTGGVAGWGHWETDSEMETSLEVASALRINTVEQEGKRREKDFSPLPFLSLGSFWSG